MFTQRWRYRKYCQNIYATKGPKFWAKVSPRAFGKQNEKTLKIFIVFRLWYQTKITNWLSSKIREIQSSWFLRNLIVLKTAHSFDLVTYCHIMNTVHLILWPYQWIVKSLNSQAVGLWRWNLFGDKEFFLWILISKMDVKMNFRIITKNNAADTKIEST